MKNSRALGQIQELAAGAYLKTKGYQILHTNYYTPFGEIDIVAKKKNHLAFIEVKSRKAASMTLAQEAVDRRKQKRIIKSAQHYLLRHAYQQLDISFDVIAISEGQSLEHIINAFRADESVI